MESLLLTLRQINICLNFYDGEAVSANDMTFAQLFLLNEIFAMDSASVCSAALCERIGFTKSSISRTLKELRKNGYIRMRTDRKDNRKKHIILTEKAYSAQSDISSYLDTLNDCLLKQIPPKSLTETQDTLQRILENLQETNRRPI